ncbi:sigma-70 family RNA polymerase sigma factor, partial [Candidatus Poribacteria bacterium]
MRTEDGYIIYRCLNGDPTAFGFLIDKYKAGVYASAYERLRNFHDAEDIAQEAFFKAYRSLRTLKRWDSFASWLYRITLNLCTDWLRAESRRPDQDFIEDQDQEILESPSRNTYRQESVYGSVREALDSLPAMHRQVLTLRYLAGMTSVEIARFVGISPSAIRMRLSKARSLLKEEILAMMSTTFDEQKLQSTFTLRIVEAIKKMKIQTIPRTTELPWALSLATGLIFTVLSFTLQPGIINRVAAGSSLPIKTKVLEVGEIPVDVLKVSEVPILASKQGATSDKDVIIDPRTGIKYTKTKSLTLVGKSNVDLSPDWLNLSPNGKFLLSGKSVVPMDGGDPFHLVDMPVAAGSWSPDGRKVVFYSRGSIWMIPVSPDTGRAADQARKLLDGEYWNQIIVGWSPNSERIVFERIDKEIRGDIWTLSVTDGSLTRITDDPVRERRPTWSPDGKTIAYNKREGGGEIWVVSAESRTPGKIIDKGYRPSWSPDSAWLVYKVARRDRKFRFFRLADGRKLDITPPDEVGQFFSWSTDGKKMLFYRSPYEEKFSFKVVSTSGGLSFELGRNLKLYPYSQFWTPDSRMIITAGSESSASRTDPYTLSMIITAGESKDGKSGFWIIPLSGGEPFLLELDVLAPGESNLRTLSPDCRKLIFAAQQDDGTADLWVASISMEDGRAIGPAVKIFDGWGANVGLSKRGWSTDGMKIATSRDGDIWIASAQGGEPVQITNAPGGEYYPAWSPDGEMIAYTYRSEGESIMVVSASGGEA